MTLPIKFRHVVGLPLAAVFAVGCGHPSEAGQGPHGPPPVSVKIAVTEQATIRDTTEYVGILKSRRSITVQPQVDGQVTRIFVKSGDEVTAGTAIMQIDPARQQAQVSSAQASRASREATLRYAGEQHERLDRLYAGGAVSRQELDQARSALEAAKADVNALGAQVREGEVQLNYFRITAPAHGWIGDIPVRVGDHVTPATRLTTLDENNLLEAYISVPIERASKLRADMPVQIIDNDGVSIADSRVSFIAPQVSEDTQSVLVKAIIGNQRGDLRAAQFVRARLVWSTHLGPTIPATAIQRLNGQSFAFIAEEQGGKLVARQRAITIGELLEHDYEVRSGIKAGERVVISGVQKLSDGSALVPQT